ncbi:MAG: RNA polymerase sigma factor [Phycisphaerae bacterium]
MPKQCDLSDLMDRAASGDQAVFGALAAEVQDDLFRFGLAQGLTAADAAEAVQETLLRAFERRRAWRRGASVMAWLYGFAMNVVREMRRKRPRGVGVDPEVLADVLRDGSAPAAADGTSPEELAALAAALADLPPRQQEVVACRYLRQMNVRDTAAAMSCAEGTVRATLTAALVNLRRRMARWA